MKVTDIRKAINELYSGDPHLDQLVKEIEARIKNFDKENYQFRYKYFDVFYYDGDIFVDYVTQGDHNFEGEEDLAYMLHHNVGDRVDVYLYYNVRDTDKAGNRNYRTREGYERVW